MVVNVQLVLFDPVQPSNVTPEVGIVVTTLSLVGEPPDSWTKLTVEPFTKLLPAIVTVWLPVTGAVVGAMEVTAGTLGFHCQLLSVIV